MSRREQILDAARRLFYDRGYQAVGIDAIGAEVGIAGPSIYFHFTGKAEILAVLFDESMDRMLELAGPPRADPREEIGNLVHAHAAFAVAQRQLLRIYTREERSLTRTAHRRFRKRERPISIGGSMRSSSCSRNDPERNCAASRRPSSG